MQSQFFERETERKLFITFFLLHSFQEFQSHFFEIPGKVPYSCKSLGKPPPSLSSNIFKSAKNLNSNPTFKLLPASPIKAILVNEDMSFWGQGVINSFYWHAIDSIFTRWERAESPPLRVWSIRSSRSHSYYQIHWPDLQRDQGWQ